MLFDDDGKAVARTEASPEIASHSEYEFAQQLTVERPRLWSVEDPHVYKVRSTIREQGQLVDEYDTPIGIRDAVFDADKGFLLNGQRVKLNGVCLHHDGGGVGAAVPERVWERRLEILREMGCNAIRTSHNPYAAEFLDLCDRMGFLVMNEAFDEWRVPKGQIGPHGYSITLTNGSSGTCGTSFSVTATIPQLCCGAPATRLVIKAPRTVRRLLEIC
jgi:beta-galactosidase